MDGWYKIPQNTGPRIHRATSIYQYQEFNLLIFLRGHAVDQENNVRVTYDVQVYDPKGIQTDDKSKDLLAYEGPAGSPNALILNQQHLKIIFTEKYTLGT